MTLFLCAFLSSCKVLKKTVEVPVYIHDTTNTVREVHDSTYVDRWHTVEVKGDTVFATDIRVESKYVTRYDTVYKIVEKPVTLTETVEVAKPLSWWQKALMWSGVAALVVLLAVLLAKFWQLFRR